MKLKVKRLFDYVPLPKYQYVGDACFDITVIINKDVKPTSDSGELIFADNFDSVIIEPGASVVFHTGLKFETDSGYNMKVYVRSSIGIKKHLILSNATGVIDTATYRGELMIGLTNIGKSTVTISNMERVAQAEIVKTLDVEMEEVDNLTDTLRGAGGIGSTGKL